MPSRLSQTPPLSRSVTPALSEMEFTSGNIYIRAPLVGGLATGAVVLGHQHHFDHTTFVIRGRFLVEQFEVLELGAAGLPIRTRTVAAAEVRSTDDNPWLLIKKGTFHSLTALEDNSRYLCVYSHRMPQAVTMEPPGQQLGIPTRKVDADGVAWYREDPRVVQEHTGWADAYR
jgi:hypothetical protein